MRRRRGRATVLWPLWQQAYYGPNVEARSSAIPGRSRRANTGTKCAGISHRQSERRSAGTLAGAHENAAACNDHVRLAPNRRATLPDVAGQLSSHTSTCARLYTRREMRLPEASPRQRDNDAQKRAEQGICRRGTFVGLGTSISDRKPSAISACARL